MSPSIIETNGTNGVNGHSGLKSQEILKTLNGINGDSFENDGQRIEAVAAAYALVARLETPWDFVLRLAMGQVSADLSDNVNENGC